MNSTSSMSSRQINDSISLQNKVSLERPTWVFIQEAGDDREIRSFCIQHAIAERLLNKNNLPFAKLRQSHELLNLTHHGVLRESNTLSRTNCEPPTLVQYSLKHPQNGVVKFLPSFNTALKYFKRLGHKITGLS